MKRIALVTSFSALFIALLLTAGACKRGGGDDAKKGAKQPATAAGGMSEEIKKGRKLYINNTCATCHGNEGKGDGPAGLALRPKPRNLQKTNEYKQGSTVDDITETIKTGVPGTNMQSFKHISPEDRTAIAKFVVYLQKN